MYNMTRYEKNGYKNRKDYLEQLAEDYGLDFDLVVQLAVFLGEDEDFDGLVSMVNEASDFNI